MACYSSTLLGIVGHGLKHALQDDEYFTRGFRQLKADIDPSSLQYIGGLQREITIEHASKGAKAACLIFHHAGLEAALEKVAAASVIEPDRWHKIIGDKKLTIQDLVNKAPSEVIRSKIDERLIQFERDPLISKTQTLFRIYHPSATILSGYGFSEERLTRIDRLRHQCAHGGCDVADFSSFEDDIDYLTRTGEYFINSAANALGIILHEPTLAHAPS